MDDGKLDTQGGDGGEDVRGRAVSESRVIVASLQEHLRSLRTLKHVSFEQGEASAAINQAIKWLSNDVAKCGGGLVSHQPPVGARADKPPVAPVQPVAPEGPETSAEVEGGGIKVGPRRDSRPSG